jgi:hypothetical protein
LNTYHAENQQEAFLVRRECTLLSRGADRGRDFFCPADRDTLGAGEGVRDLMGRRSEPWKVLYPVSELAARYGASAEQETSDPDQAYVGFEPSRRERPSYWDRLPWA